MSEDNKAVVRKFFDAWNTGDLDSLDEVTAPDVVDHDRYNPNAGEGVEGAKKTIAMYREAFPDLHMTVEEQVAEGDLVVTRWTATGTHKGEVMGFAPTGNKGVTNGISWDRVSDGKVVEARTEWDVFNMMQLIGAIPQPEGAQA